MNLKEIVEQLESCRYECEGGSLANNTAFIELKAMTELLDLKDLPFLEIQISYDGTKVWMYTEEKCIVRIQNIETVGICDMRRE